MLFLRFLMQNIPRARVTKMGALKFLCSLELKVKNSCKRTCGTLFDLVGGFGTHPGIGRGMRVAGIFDRIP